VSAAIEVRGVGKCYQHVEERPTLLTSLVPLLRTRKSPRWALRDINFSLQPGETVGVLGRNGAGKTTMLRLLAGVTKPTEGSVTTRGRIAPLISVGVGFHQEMTGRENVFVNGMLLGLSRRQVERRLDEIVAFAELESYLDTPVKFYSTGMYMRLGFSVAAHVDPDILLVDEVLAVGDIAFQLKCFERMRALQSEGTTILLVSHSMHAIRLLCPRGILIRRGLLVIDGTAEEAIARHQEMMTSDASDDDSEAAVSVVSRELLGPDGPTHHPRVDDHLVYRVAVRFNTAVDTPQVHFQLVGEDGTLVYSIMTVVGRSGSHYQRGDVATVEVPFVAQLGAGTYQLRTVVTDRNDRQTLAFDSAGFSMYIDPVAGVGGFADVKASIYIDGSRVSDYDQLLLSAPGPERAPEPPS
jgi:ABC-type polysaccharide/polyol phosphate transport system ATPase subunit